MFNKNFFLQFHPITCSTLALIAGILYQQQILSFLFFIITILLSLTFEPFNKNKSYHIISLILFFGSFFLGIYRINNLESENKNLLNLICKKPINCCVKIMEVEDTNHIYFKKGIQCELISVNNQEIKKGNLIKLYVPKIGQKNLEIGDIIKIKNLNLKEIKNKDYQKYLFKEGILASNFISKLSYKLISRNEFSISKLLYKLKTSLILSLKEKMNPLTWAFFNVIFLGKKLLNASIEDIKHHFNLWGISHYLARSGLHVILIIGIWHFMLRFIPISFFIKQIIICFLIVIYHILTWSSISFKRALLTFLLYKLCIIKSFPIHQLHILSLTTFLILIHNPYQIFFLDFQLSFSITCSLILFNEFYYIQNISKKTIEANIMNSLK